MQVRPSFSDHRRAHFFITFFLNFTHLLYKGFTYVLLSNLINSNTCWLKMDCYCCVLMLDLPGTSIQKNCFWDHVGFGAFHMYDVRSIMFLWCSQVPPIHCGCLFCPGYDHSIKIKTWYQNKPVKTVSSTCSSQQTQLCIPGWFPHTLISIC